VATRIELPGVPKTGELYSSIAENFSLARGGPFYRLQLRLHAAEEEAVRVAGRAAAAVLLTWLPLLILSAQQGLALGTRVRIPFLWDFAANARCLIALPLLIASEIGIDCKLRAVVAQFLKSGLVKQAGLPAFEATIKKVIRLRDHTLPELVIAIFAYIPSWSIQNHEILLGSTSNWHWVPAGSGEALSYAGWWFGLISAPVFRFLLLRWLWRMLLWASFLWRVSKLDLVLVPTHPDLAAGLGFVSEAQLWFGAITLAGSIVIAGQLGDAIAYDGATVSGLKFLIIGYCAFAVMIEVAPLLLLFPTLFRVKKRGLFEYGAFAAGYTQAFDAKWLRGQPPAGEALLGNSDVQSLADLGNSFAIVRNMRMIPIDKSTLIVLAVPAVAPMLLVLLLATPAEEIIHTILKLLT
jgi:hypothetical protein